MTRKLFGTDGVRGRANTYPMTAEMALKLGAAVGGLFAVAFADTARLGIRLTISAFAVAGCFAARLVFRFATRLDVRALLHRLADLLQDRGDFRIGFAGGVLGEFAGLLLGLGGGLLSLGGLFVRLFHRGVLLGFLHGFMEALLFVGAKLDRQSGQLAAFLSGALGARGLARGFVGGEAEGRGEEEQGEVLHDNS
jgi:hypothetical protein